MSESDELSIVEQAERAGYLAMFYLELTSGLRRGELLALLWSDVDTTTCTISVSKQVIRVNGKAWLSAYPLS